ncbi:hypothetical protein GWE18_26435 [Bradyrhizobium sp. CSA112]|nr:hypothetical protein [Bradyrhizobium sp. CSA112]
MRSTLSFVRSFAGVAVRKLRAFGEMPGDAELKVEDLDPRMKFDVSEAWLNLHVFPQEIAKEIAAVKTNLDAFYVAIEDYNLTLGRRLVQRLPQ